MARTWNYNRASKHIDSKLADVRDVEVVEYTRELSLNKIPTHKAYRVHGAHIYIDIKNIDEMLHVTNTEGETCHKRTLRFLNLHYRAVDRILQRTQARRVDFHNQRLHALVTKPYNTDDDAESKRVHRAVSISQLAIDVLRETGEEDEYIPNAKVRVGICTGTTLAVNNGRSGDREPLFLGGPANHAAKMSGGGTAKGIFLTNAARWAIGLKEVTNPAATPLTKAEIEQCQEKAALEVTKDEIVSDWKEDLEKHPIGAFAFTRAAPPLRTLDIAMLTPGNSRRQDAVSVYADLSGFTAYVDGNIDNKPEDVVRVLHVIRAELARVLSSEFDGRRVRFIGDCVHGLLCEGTSRTTDAEETISTATLCAGGLRSSFELAITKLQEADVGIEDLGLAIGFEFGPMTVTRLGLHGSRVRCSVSRGVLSSEAEQRRCGGEQTAIGPAAYAAGTEAVRDLFGPLRQTTGLDYNEAVSAMADKGDEIAKAAQDEAFLSAPVGVSAAAARTVRPYARSG